MMLSLVAKAKASPGLIGRDLTREVMPQESYTWELGLDQSFLLPPIDPVTQTRVAVSDRDIARCALRPHVVALDFGMKWNILRHLVEIGCQVTVMPGSASRRRRFSSGPRRHLHLQRPGRSRRSEEATEMLQDARSHCRPSRAGFRSSASASGISFWARPSARRRSSSSSGIEARIIRCGTRRPARSRSRRRTTGSRLTHRAFRADVEADPYQPERPDARRDAAQALADLQRPVSSRGIGRPARQPVPLQGFSPHAAGAAPPRGLRSGREGSVIMSMTIRVASADDAAQCLEIYAPFCLETPVSFESEAPSLEEMRRRIKKTLDFFPWLIAEGEGRVLGYAYASRHRERAGYRWAADVSVYVREGERGKGVGRALYTSLFAILRLQGIYSVLAGITLPNRASVVLHEAMGLRPLGVYSRIGYKCGAWHDVGWWQRALRSHDDGPPAEPIAFPALRDSAACAAAIRAGTAND